MFTIICLKKDKFIAEQIQDILDGLKEMMKVSLIDLQEHKKIKTESLINWITFK